MGLSVIYRNVWCYRLIMNILYAGGYIRRFERVAGLIRPTELTVHELCFGDVVLAEYCRSQGKQWIGYDLSEPFVAGAVSRGFDARRQDVIEADAFPRSDVCIMMGALYHFHGRLPDLFRRIRRSSRRLIISEPVRNWTNAGWLAGLLARKLTRAGASEETFRFDKTSLMQVMGSLAGELGFTYTATDAGRDMIVEVVWSS